MISIIIPTFNRADLLRNTLKSILRCNSLGIDFEILVIDNGSSDNTKLIVDEFIEKSSDLTISYHFEPIPGLLSGRHRGFHESKGDILTFIDDDVEVSESWLSGIDEIMKSKKDISLLTGPCLPKYESSPPDWLDYFWIKDENGTHCGWLSLLDFGNEEKEIDPLFVWGLNFTIRKSVLLDLGGFHPDNMPKALQMFQGDGETGLALKAKSKHRKAFYSPKVKLNHQVPSARLTIEYFEQRAFYQGVANSFTNFKSGNSLNMEKVSLFKQIKRKFKSVMRHKVKNELPAEITKLKQDITNSQNEGYLFHQKQIVENEQVKNWVEKENYLDYNYKKND